ncbi:MAG TPA: TonB-dependent receptor [Sediminibacterium sp.]|nr:TonB-dependent receptor [Sediminibacterium sp.]
MKLAVVIILLTGLQVNATATLGQKVSLKTYRTEIKKVLKQIESEGHFRFLYNSDLKDLKTKVDFSAVNLTIEQSLAGLFAGTNLTYKQLGGNLIAVLSSDARENVRIKITGKVTGENNEALAGASVLEKGTNNGTFADNNGNFSFTVDNDATLVISSIGYEPTEVKVSGRSVVDVKLKLAIQKMDEVVVIGYGQASKRDLTGSIVKIAGKEVADKPNTNPVASLQGKVAGLSVVNNGTPGAAPDIRIRGTISIGSVRPLYVVDGVFNDNIDYINPNDIESIEVLKDPSSLAIFGVRGAAGVIAVTTKRAKAGQMVINLNSSYGFKKLVDKIKLASGEEFKTLYEEEKVNIGAVSPFDYSKYTSNTDWIDAVTRTGRFNTNNLSVATSTDKNKFNFGLGYTTDEGIIRHEKLEKLQLSLNDEVKLSKVLKVGVNLNATRQNNPYDATYILDQARKVIPLVSNGTIAVKAKNPYGLDSLTQNLYYDLPSIQNSGVVNPLIQLENEWNKTKSVEYRTVGSVFGELNFLRDFTFKASFYADMSTVNTRKYTPVYNAYDATLARPFLYSRTTSVNEGDISYRKFQQDYILNYRKSFGEHNLTAMAGWTTYYFGSFNRTASAKQSATGSPIPDDARFWYIENGFSDPTSKTANSDQRERTTASALFRALYNYQGKYFLNASFRRDGSSQISPANRWQNFWAVGGAWEISREKFFQGQNIFDYMKLKASMGVLGNQNTYGYDYPFYPGLVAGNAAVFGNLVYNAFSQSYLPNPNLKWETVHAKEIGLEFNALKNKLHVEASYFNKLTKDLMTFIPGSQGVSNGLDNIGSIRNSGFELSASYTQDLSKDLILTVSGNLTTYKNKVESLATKEFSIQSGVNRTTVGLPIGYFYGYIVEGIYQSYADKLSSPVNTEFSYGPGDLKYKDVNGDGKINTADRTMIGNPTPDFTYGGTISLKYKNLDFSVDLGGVYGNEVFRNWGGTESPFQRVNYAKFKLNRWHGEGTSNWDPILAQDHRINYEASTYNIEDGSYFRIRNIQLGYNLSSAMLSKAKIKNVRAFVNVQNLKTWKNNSGYTSEFGGSAISFGMDNAGGAIPLATTFGLNVTF